MNLKTIACLSLVALMLSPAFGADDEKKKKRAANKGNANRGLTAQLLKKLEPVGLTDEQVAKIKELGMAVQKEVKAARESAGITQEIQKKLAEAQKSMKEKGSELKGAERMAAIHKAAGLTEDQAAALKKSNMARQELTKKAMALLTDEQKSKVKGAGRKGGAKGKPDGEKKKKKAA